MDKCPKPNVKDHEILYVHPKEWGRIRLHMDRKRITQEALDKEAAHRKALKDGSDAMTKEWPNSLEKLREKKEQDRLAKIEQKKDDRIQRFYKMRDEQEVIRKELVAEVKRKMYMTGGYPKQLNSALVLSETLYERQQQTKFDEFLRAHFAAEEAKIAEKVKREAEEEKLEKEREKIEAYQKKINYGKILKEEIQRREREKVESRKNRVAKEIVDYRKAEEEMELLKQWELDEKMRKKHEAMLAQRKEIDEDLARRAMAEAEQKELDEVTSLYHEAKSRIDCMRKTKEKTLRAAEIAQREEMAKKAIAVQKAKDDKEEEIIRAAQAEKDALEDEKKRARAELDARLKQERIDDRQQYLARIAKQQRKQEEIKKWQMLNRFKTEEVSEVVKMERLKKNWAKILEYRQELLDQMAEKKQRLQDEIILDERIQEVSFSESDRMFYEYAKEVMELAKSKGRSTYPIEKVIMYVVVELRELSESQEKCVKKVLVVNSSSYDDLKFDPKSRPKLYICRYLNNLTKQFTKE